MNKITSIIISIFIIGIAGWFLLRGDTATKESDLQTEQKKAPSFALQNYDGEIVKLEDFEDKPLVINSWASWCSFCRKELIDFAEVQKEFGNQVIIIAINRVESREVAKRYSDELGVTDGILFLLDPTDSFYQSIGGFSMPETIFVDKDGFIREHKRGLMEIPDMREKIKLIL